MTARRAPLSGDRWHFQHGPIDLVIGAEGDRVAVEAAHADAWRRFAEVLTELVGELPSLRRRVESDCPLRGPVARRMWQACALFGDRFITPMAAVAGSVAEELIAHYQRHGIERAWINNGGDIALHLAPGRSVRVGLVADLSRFDAVQALEGLAVDGSFDVRHDSMIRGIATSGWRGRSFSLGIADSVTVLARTASQADAAATVIANAVDVDDARIVRRPACEVKDDSDLGTIQVTVDVPALDRSTVARALASGIEQARELHRRGLIVASVLVCQGQIAVVDDEELGLTSLERGFDTSARTDSGMCMPSNTRSSRPTSALPLHHHPQPVRAEESKPLLHLLACDMK